MPHHLPSLLAGHPSAPTTCHPAKGTPLTLTKDPFPTLGLLLLLLGLLGDAFQTAGSWLPLCFRLPSPFPSSRVVVVPLISSSHSPSGATSPTPNAHSNAHSQAQHSPQTPPGIYSSHSKMETQPTVAHTLAPTPPHEISQQHIWESRKTPQQMQKEMADKIIISL